MPVFNTDRYLRCALESVRNQSFRAFELIVLNDGSTDRSADILRNFARGEPRLRLIDRPNRGLIATRNELLNEAQFDLVAWMDSDDLSHVDRLKLQVAAFDEDEALVCLGTNIQLVDPEGHPLGFEKYPHDDRAVREAQLSGGGLRFASTMQRRLAAVGAGGFRQPFRIGEDLDFLLRVADLGRIGNLPDNLYIYRQHLLSTCMKLGLNWPEYSSVILELASERRKGGEDRLQRGEVITLPVPERRDQDKLIPVVLLDWARGAVSAGDRLRAIRYALKSIAASPRRVAGWRQLVKLLLFR